MASYIAVFRYGLCFFKNTSHKVNRWTPILSGFFSSFGILWEPAGRRLELALYMLPKTLEAFWKWLKHRNLVKSVPFGEILLFAFAMGVIMHCYQNEEKSIKPTYKSILAKFYGNN